MIQEDILYNDFRGRDLEVIFNLLWDSNNNIANEMKKHYKVWQTFLLKESSEKIVYNFFFNKPPFSVDRLKNIISEIKREFSQEQFFLFILAVLNFGATSETNKVFSELSAQTQNMIVEMLRTE